MSTIGTKIKNIRELKNYTQEYVAKKLEMTQAGYSKIERDETDVPYSKLEEIARVLEVGVDDLVAFDKQKFFNSFNNVKDSNIGHVTITEMSKEIKKLYDDKIALLEKLAHHYEAQLNRYKERFGDI